MKKYYYILPFVLACLCIPFLASCDDEDDGSGDPSTETSIVNPSKVFTAGLPSMVGGNKIVTDEKGRVVRLEREDLLVTFDYSALTRAAKADVVMTIEDDGDIVVCNLTLNDQGFVSFCDENSHSELDGDEHQTWKFTYDSSGHLTKMVRSEGGNETTTITWVNGDITDVRTVSEEDPEDSSHYTLNYEMYAFDENGEVEEAKLIDNVASVMFFDEMFGIDMDEMTHAYWAGLLGKATKHLPSSLYDEEDQSTTFFSWRWDDDYRPTAFSFEEGRYYKIVW